MKSFPKTIYVTRSDDNDEYIEYYVETDQTFVDGEEQDTEVAVYRLEKTGKVVKSSKIVFE